ncbi:hypothetical protein BU14_2289s0001 [Porphyra umbilicalis]|uniref:Uncharacterized protein n=1 Tax=Porphyra umbilicalis TaxID=2786 RepID=A0A1X6NJF8_PORUM|nr:hypothetical protein BU14_2289s0001 [Porphyra umbilicalis]|eukprot:OSX68754.1 hypothetical protein BU14_2289s0001 [Porphyra umbilicalis]
MNLRRKTPNLVTMTAMFKSPRECLPAAASEDSGLRSSMWLFDVLRYLPVGESGPGCLSCGMREPTLVCSPFIHSTRIERAHIDAVQVLAETTLETMVVW